MPETLTKGMIRNIYFGGSVFSILLFLALTHHIEEVPPERANEATMSAAVVHGKPVWEQNSCVGCHTLLGEGAYFAPELGNVVGHRGGKGDFNTFLQAWMKIQPLNVSGRRAVPQFHPSEGQVDDLAEFFRWSSKINTNQWPPNKEG